MGVISSIMTDDAYKELREALELDNSSQVLMFSTEGDTDPGLGVFSTCLCYFLQTTAQKHVNSTKAAIILSTESLFGSIFSVLLGYDPLSAQMVVGGVIILASIILPEFSFGKKEEPAVVEKKEEV